MVPGIGWLTAFLDMPAQSFEVGTAFWESVTGCTASPLRGSSGQFATLLPPQGDAYLRVQRTDEGQGGCHMDVHVERGRIAEVVQYAVSLGASTCPATPGRVGRTVSSPGGFLFLVGAHEGEGERPRPQAWRAAHRSLVDQLCLDVPPSSFDSEASFWAAFTGWERRPGFRPEFAYLQRPSAIPLRLLFQRLDDGDAQGVRAHLDIACDDIAAEVERHVALGATPVRAMPDWTTLRSPVGQEYCVTRRDPGTGTLPS